MLKIKLVRFGKKNQPFYRIVLTQAKKKLKGRYLELLGTYDPLVKPFRFKIDKEKYADWLKKGAKPTERIASLMKKPA